MSVQPGGSHPKINPLDCEADVVVVGLGAAGLAACIEARRRGLSVIGFESQSQSGGSSRISGGGMLIPDTAIQRKAGIQDSVELMNRDILAFSGEDANKEMIAVYCRLSSGLAEWLSTMGVRFEDGDLVAAMGQSVAREHFVDANKLCDRLQSEAERLGAKLCFTSPVVRLERNCSANAVTGVSVMINGRLAMARARLGVLMASGGFTRNVDMLNAYVFGTGAEDVHVVSSAGDDGSGLKMCMAIGADTRHMSYGSLYAVQHPDGDEFALSAMYHLGGILVNKSGRRFVDESKGFGRVWEDVDRQWGSECYCIWDGSVAAGQKENHGKLYSQAYLEKTGLLVSAESIEELALKLEVPVFSLVATVEKYNSDLLDYGYDSQFGRKHLIAAAGRPLPLVRPPFYAWKTRNALLVTCGGLRKDIQCRVLDVFGDPIVGLYAAGNVSGYSELGVIPRTRQACTVSGMGLGGALVFGRYAISCMNQRTT